jgi:hypothetical protein
VTPKYSFPFYQTGYKEDTQKYKLIFLFSRFFRDKNPFFSEKQVKRTRKTFPLFPSLSYSFSLLITTTKPFLYTQKSREI